MHSLDRSVRLLQVEQLPFQRLCELCQTVSVSQTTKIRPYLVEPIRFSTFALTNSNSAALYLATRISAPSKPSPLTLAEDSSYFCRRWDVGEVCKCTLCNAVASYSHPLVSSAFFGSDWNRQRSVSGTGAVMLIFIVGQSKGWWHQPEAKLRNQSGSLEHCIVPRGGQGRINEMLPKKPFDTVSSYQEP